MPRPALPVTSLTTCTDFCYRDLCISRAILKCNVYKEYSLTSYPRVLYLTFAQHVPYYGFECVMPTEVE